MRGAASNRQLHVLFNAAICDCLRLLLCCCVFDVLVTTEGREWESGWVGVGVGGSRWGWSRVVFLWWAFGWPGNCASLHKGPLISAQAGL